MIDLKNIRKVWLTYGLRNPIENVRQRQRAGTGRGRIRDNGKIIL